MHIKTKRILFLFIILAALLRLTTGLTLGKDNPLSLLATQSTVTTGFTYQGQLTEGSVPAEGVFDLQFELYDAVTDGTLLGTVALENVVVTEGLFTVLLDFGAGVFDGQARWLAIGVRAGTETGTYTPLTPRQALTAAPYAQYAMEAGSVAWEDVDDNPLPDNCTADQLVTWNETLSVWECVADTDTTYSAGFGLELDGNTFTVLTDTLQTRVTDGCAEGSTIRVITADGSVECETHDTRPVFSRTTIDIVGDDRGIALHNSITIGADGLPVISYYDGINHDLKVTRCNDLACTSSTSTNVDNSGDVGWYNSITIGADGLPVISYFDRDNRRLKVARCHDATCSSATTIIMGSAGDKSTSITIGVDGLPVISYYSYGSLMVAHCNDAACTSSTSTNVDTSGDVGWYNSITIGVDGLPVISYYDRDNRGLKVAHCNDIACTSAATTALNSAKDIGFDTSITIGADGLPVISYYADEFTLDELRIKVAHCNDAACTNATTTVVDTTERNENDIYTTSITIGADGLPVLSYFEGTNYDLKVAHCNDAVCTSATATVVDTTGNVGLYNAITIGDDGLPIISYYDDTTRALKVTHCSNPFCVPYFRRR